MRPKYKELYIFQKKMSFVLLTTNFVLLFILIVFILDRIGSIELSNAQQNLNRINDKIQAQAADGYREMYDNKPAEYKLPEDEEQVIRAIFGDLADEAIAIGICESGIRNDARNPNSSATGIFQVLSYTHGIRGDWLENPLINTVVAKQLYDNRGNWGAWEACSERLGLE